MTDIVDRIMTMVGSCGGPSVAVGLCLAGCAALPGDRLVRTEDGQVEISISGSTTPVVVFESGLMSYKRSGIKYLRSYRPPTGCSPTIVPASEKARRRGGLAMERRSFRILRLLLRSQHLPPPYVLVGHSAGGLYMQLYARRDPDEVAGLVLVDPTHPTQFEGEGSMQHRSTLSNLVIAAALTATAKAEFAALDNTGHQVLASPPARADLPIAILIAPDTSGGAIASLDNAKRRDFAKLYPQAALSDIDSSHGIPQERPQAVIDAIRDILKRIARHAENPRR